MTSGTLSNFSDLGRVTISIIPVLYVSCFDLILLFIMCTEMRNIHGISKKYISSHTHLQFFISLLIIQSTKKNGLWIAWDTQLGSTVLLIPMPECYRWAPPGKQTVIIKKPVISCFRTCIAFSKG